MASVMILAHVKGIAFTNGPWEAAIKKKFGYDMVPWVFLKYLLEFYIAS
jgi:hypothetical protein